MLALVAGLIAFIPLFGALFTGNLLPGAATLVAYFGGGFVIGRSNPRLWALAVLLAWPCIFSSLWNLALGAGVSLALVVLTVPAAVALIGGYLGRRSA